MAFGSEPVVSMKTRATYEDLLAVPDHKVAEILDGELFVSPRPASPHARASSVLGVTIGGAFDQGRRDSGGWWVLDEPELHFDDDVLVPDLAAWRRERMPSVPNAAYFTLAPDWVCEVISPSTEQIDRRASERIYARAGVRHLWLVNPLSRTLEVYRQAPEGWLLVGTHGGDERVRAEPFDAVELDLATLSMRRPRRERPRQIGKKRWTPDKPRLHVHLPTSQNSKRKDVILRLVPEPQEIEAGQEKSDDEQCDNQGREALRCRPCTTVGREYLE